MPEQSYIHIYRCEHPERARAQCPYHKKLEYGERQSFYDTTRVFFDCGAMADYGYGEYTPPKLYKNITIFKDETGFTVWAPRAGYEFLAKFVPLERARLIARKRLANGGRIKDESCQ